MNTYGTLNDLVELLRDRAIIEIYNRITHITYFETVGYIKENWDLFSYAYEIIDFKVDGKKIYITISKDIEF